MTRRRQCPPFASDEISSLVDRTARTVAIPLKLVHVVRNPFDNIATMYLRGRYPILRLPLAACIADFARMAQTVERVKTLTPTSDIFELHFETLVERARESLEALSRFSRSTRITTTWTQRRCSCRPRSRPRDRIAWAASNVRAVEAIIEKLEVGTRVYIGSRPDRVYASATARAGRPRHGPNFLVVGAQRAGTTLMHRMLALHPEVYIPERRRRFISSTTITLGASGGTASSSPSTETVPLPSAR